MSKRITITLTRAGLEALWLAAGNVLQHPDVVAGFFPHPSSRRAAYRAAATVADALGVRSINNPTKEARP